LEGNSGGSGQGGDIVYWSGTDKASQWYLHNLDKRTSINDIISGEGDEAVAVYYYTIGGTAIAAPVQGVNIVKTVYANGVIKTEKIYVK
jgi:ferritin-like protein